MQDLLLCPERYLILLELYQACTKLGVIKMKYPSEVIASKHVQLKKGTKRKLAELELHTLRGITCFSVHSFFRYIDLVAGKNTFSAEEMGDIIRATRKKKLWFKCQNSFQPHSLPADIVAMFWKQNIRTYQKLALKSRFEVVQILMTQNSGNVAVRTEDLEHELKIKGLALRTDPESLDRFIHSNKIMRRVVIELYMRGIRTTEDVADTSENPKYYLGKRKKPKPAERKAEIKERLAVYCYHMREQRQKN